MQNLEMGIVCWLNVWESQQCCCLRAVAPKPIKKRVVCSCFSLTKSLLMERGTFPVDINTNEPLIATELLTQQLPSWIMEYDGLKTSCHSKVFYQ